ncbi:flagellar hook-basal body complex protein [Caproiciproducens sp.]|uniref:flagellar hook-basal body complex protein n=1 Tax=Caproiciproducens sp. TaxID=1954376 RepID=UPI0028A21EA7|nr:flagellar hook-basal body complex protein [Caproiciproducens sp.]
MMRAMFSAVAGLKAHQTGFDVIGNNISNVNTYGFKASSTLYRDVYYQTISGSSNGTASTIAGANPSQVGYGATAASVDVNNARSGMATTGNGMDCYINGEGYFVVKDGDDFLYTRVGRMSFDAAGNLVDGNKRIVCGAPADAGTTKPTPINVSGYGDYKNITIGGDGKITGEKGGTVYTIGTIAIASVANPAGLTQQGESYYKAVSNTGDIKWYAPGTATAGGLVTGALESSNVDLANEFSQMIVTERGFQANSKIITVSDEMLENLVNLKR